MTNILTADLLQLITMQHQPEVRIKALPILNILTLVKSRIDTFLVHNPDIKKENIPSELVTASDSGIDPDITPEVAFSTDSRISKTRNINTKY